VPELTENPSKDPLLSTPEAALDLNCSTSFLAKARMTGTGPEFVKLGRAIRYRRSALNAYKAAQTRKSTSQYHEVSSQPQHQRTLTSRPRRKAKKGAHDLLDALSITVHRGTSEYI
jgi:predicted DNA-binding transcriptional regulator AlpA